MYMNEFNIADVVIIVFIIVSTYFYYNKGLVLTVLGFFTMLFSTVLSGVLGPLVAGFLKTTSIYESINSYVGETLLGSSLNSGENIIDSFNLPEFLKTALSDNIQSADPSKYITGFIVNILSMLIVFVLLFVIFKIIANALNIINYIPVFRTANKLLGGVLGFAQSVIVIWIVFAVLAMLYGKPMFSGIIKTVSDSLIASKFYDSNILIKGLSAVTDFI